MIPHIAKVNPAGANKFGYKSDISPVLRPASGNDVAR